MNLEGLSKPAVIVMGIVACLLLGGLILMLILGVRAGGRRKGNELLAASRPADTPAESDA